MFVGDDITNSAAFENFKSILLSRRLRSDRVLRIRSRAHNLVETSGWFPLKHSIHYPIGLRYRI